MEEEGNPGSQVWSADGVVAVSNSILNTRELIGVVEEQTPGVKRRVLI